MNTQLDHEINQPVSVDRHAKDKPTVKERNLTVNPGDRIADKPEGIEEKAKQVAVDQPDITGDWIKVPTYFIVEYPNGEKRHYIM